MKKKKVMYLIVELNPFRALGHEIKFKVETTSNWYNVYAKIGRMRNINTNVFLTHVKSVTGKAEKKFIEKYKDYSLTRDTPFYGSHLNEVKTDWFVLPADVFKRMILEERFLDVRGNLSGNSGKVLPGVDKFEYTESEEELIESIFTRKLIN